MLLEIGQLVYSDLEPFGLDLGYTLTDDVATWFKTTHTQGIFVMRDWFDHYKTLTYFHNKILIYDEWPLASIIINCLNGTLRKSLMFDRIELKKKNIN